MNGFYKFLEQLIPATVNIHTLVQDDHPSASTLGVERAGSGTIIDAAGHILTVGYVVLGAETITVTLQRGDRVPAHILHIDFDSGLAVLQADIAGSCTMPLGASSNLRPGQMGLLLAATGQTERRVTEGFITAIEQFDAHWEYMLDRAILTTAENAGFGGGAFVTLDGTMVGVVSLNLNRLKDTTVVIPLEYFLHMKDELFTHGKIRQHVPRAWVGMWPVPSSRGLSILGVTPRSPAALADVRQGDIILSIGDHEVIDRPDFYRHLWQYHAGEEVILIVMREGRSHTIPIQSQNRTLFYQ